MIPNDWYRWDALRTLGNHRLVQLTIVVPIVGYMILLNKDLAGYYALFFDDEHVGVSYWLYCLYFGFTVLGVASLIFSLFCPKLVKEYGSAAMFVASEAHITSPDRLKDMVSALVEARRRASPETYEQEWAMHGYQDRLAAEADDRPQDVMTAFFVPLKDVMPRTRLLVFALYVVGFAILTVPTVEVFARVLASVFE